MRDGGENHATQHEETDHAVTPPPHVTQHWQLSKPSAKGRRGMVVSQAKGAAEAGVAVLDAGGNAIDAAVATALALATHEPWNSGLGGIGCRLQRDECRGAHFKPDFAMPGLDAEDPAQRRRQAEQWCDRFDENSRRWLKTTIAKLSPDGEPQLSYEDVDTSLIPPRPRLYGLVGADIIEQVWKERQAAKTPSTSGNGNGQAAGAVKVAAEK